MLYCRTALSPGNPSRPVRPHAVTQTTDHTILLKFFLPHSGESARIKSGRLSPLKSLVLHSLCSLVSAQALSHR